MLGHVMVWVYECGSPFSPLLLPFSSLSPLPLPLPSPSPSPSPLISLFTLLSLPHFLFIPLLFISSPPSVLLLSLHPLSPLFCSLLSPLSFLPSFPSSFISFPFIFSSLFSPATAHHANTKSLASSPMHGRHANFSESSWLEKKFSSLWSTNHPVEGGSTGLCG